MTHHNYLANGSKFIFLIVCIIDILLANITFYTIVNCGYFLVPENLIGNELAGIICATVAAVVSVAICGNIVYQYRVNTLNMLLRILNLTFIQSIAIMAMTRMIADSSQSILRLTAIYFCVYLILLSASRFFERLVLHHIRSMGHNKRTVIYIGSDPVAEDMYNEMMNSATIAYDILGYYANYKLDNCPNTLKYLGTRKELMAAIERNEQPFYADEVYYSLTSNCTNDEVNAMINYCDKNIIQFYLIPRILSTLSMEFTPLQIGYRTLFTNHTNNVNRIDNRIIKRTFDIIFSFIVCLCLIPIIPIIWIIIKTQSPGPIFFKQERTGLNGETFLLYKFRSMHINDNADTLQATKDDPRKFPFGEFMRKTNLDEFPQFFNVLKGDMSIVGPRPHMLYHTEMYSNVISKYMVRHFSKPGITGWAQITGYRGETKELWQMEERVKRDIWYNENWSFKLDLEIIFRTIIQTFFPHKNAY